VNEDPKRCSITVRSNDPKRVASFVGGAAAVFAVADGVDAIDDGAADGADGIGETATPEHAAAESTNTSKRPALLSISLMIDPPCFVDGRQTIVVARALLRFVQISRRCIEA
jgi:hypothetical protein